MKNLILSGLLLLVVSVTMDAQERLPGIYGMRRMDQIKVPLEDFDFIMKVERGSSITTNGVISMESVNLKENKEKGTIDLGVGTLESYRISGSYTSGLSKSGWAYYVRGSALGTDGYREHSYSDSKSVSFKVGKYWEKHSLDFFSITGKYNNGLGYQGGSYRSTT